MPGRHVVNLSTTNIHPAVRCDVVVQGECIDGFIISTVWTSVDDVQPGELINALLTHIPEFADFQWSVQALPVSADWLDTPRH